MSKYFDIDQWLISFELSEPYDDRFCHESYADEPIDNKPLY